MISRREFFTQKKQTLSIRPPWSVSEGFEEKCTQCNECVLSCPKEVLIKDGNNYPVIDFNRGGCDFCQKCLDSCKHGALVKSSKAWRHNIQIKDNCLAKQGISCRSCVDYCEEDAFIIRLKLNGKINIFIDHDTCTRCGECIAICPQKAIQNVMETT